MMAEAKSREEWGRHSVLLCLLHNLQCAKKGDLKRPGDFDPYRAGEAAAPLKIKMADLKGLFVKESAGGGKR